MGSFGQHLVATLAFTEFFGDTLIVLIVMWQELASLLPAGQGALLAGHSRSLLTAPVCPPALPGPQACWRLARQADMSWGHCPCQSSSAAPASCSL